MAQTISDTQTMVKVCMLTGKIVQENMIQRVYRCFIILHSLRRSETIDVSQAKNVNIHISLDIDDLFG